MNTVPIVYGLEGFGNGSAMDEEGGRFSSRRRDGDARAAAEWFARWQAGTADAAEFAHWRDADPAHALAYARVIAAWEAVQDPDEQVASTDLPVSPLLTRRRLVRGGAAGAVLAAAGTGMLATRAYAWESASTGVGETHKLRLPDNSIAALNTDTLLSWRFSGTRRELWLERGEVAIDLRAGSAVLLASAGSSATLNEGRFNARLRGDAFELTVLRGSARLPARAGTAPVQVDAYERLSFTGAEPVVSPVSSDAAEAALAWQSGDIVFFDTPLSEAAAEYNRYLLHKIVIDDPAVGAIRVGGRFTSSDPAPFLRAVSTSLGVRVHTTAAGYRLER